MNLYRLTVHVTGVDRVDSHSKKKFRQRKQQTAVEAAMEKRQSSPMGSDKGRFKLYNTLSFYCRSMKEVNEKLSMVRSNYQIKIGDDRNKPKKYGKELYNISFVK